jgi:peptidoglycan/LPS O-acetylase OafA/YrhL
LGSHSNRYTYIDALRGVAALWVVLYHLWNRFYPALSTQAQPLAAGVPADPRSALALFAFGFGYSGVTLFFVLSGFCIHLPQARRGVYQISPGTFAARRFWRLYPAYLASIAFSVVALAIPKVLLAVHRGRTFDWWAEVHGRDALVNAAFLQQVWPESLGFNGVYWTLVFEVWFYAAYPALLFCLRKAGFLPVGAVLLACEIYSAFVPAPVRCFFPAKYFEWYLGVVAAEVIARHPGWLPATPAALCAVLGLGSGVYSVFEPAIYPLRDLFFAVGYFGLVVFVAKSRGPLRVALDWRVLVGLGAFSYSLYLIHVPVIDLVWLGLGRLAARSQSPPAVQWLSLTAIPVSLAAAYVFYRFFERPFLRTDRKEPVEQSPQPLPEKAAP